MDRAGLKDWVAKQREAGYTDEQIKQSLKKGKYTQKDIEYSLEKEKTIFLALSVLTLGGLTVASATAVVFQSIMANLPNELIYIIIALTAWIPGLFLILVTERYDGTVSKTHNNFLMIIASVFVIQLLLVSLLGYLRHQFSTIAGGLADSPFTSSGTLLSMISPTTLNTNICFLIFMVFFHIPMFIRFHKDAKLLLEKIAGTAVVYGLIAILNNVFVENYLFNLLNITF